MVEPHQLSRTDLVRLFDLLNEELAAAGVIGEIYLVGGAVMCLSLDARDATRDVDAFFRPTRLVREAADRVASRAGLPSTWLNDAVKGWLGDRGEYQTWLDRPNLRVYVALPAYLLAMKCLALRLGAEFHDLEDVRFLLRWLNLTSSRDALDVIARYFDESLIPLKTRLALEELLGHESDA